MMSRKSSSFLFTVGLLLGWAILFTSPLQWRTIGTALADPPPADSPELTAYKELMKSIQESVTGDPKHLGVCFRVDQKVGVGEYDCKIGEGDYWAGSIEVLSYGPLTGSSFDFEAAGCVAGVIICRITGPVGSVEFVGMALRPVDYTSTQIYPLARADAISTVTPSVGDKLRETVKHRTSTPASVLDHTYDLQRNPTAACAGLPADQLCICIAQKKYDSCQSDALHAFASCVEYATAAAMVAFAACLAPFVLIPGFNLFTAGGCAFWLGSGLAVALLACTEVYHNSTSRCINDFMIDMEGCGWHWAWT
jgi:hypothetical protein